jgi:drug/metabolite transporter (DMT)-like permease
MNSRHLLYFLALGCFWGLSPSLYKLMGEAGLPVTHIIVYTGLAVGIAMAAIPYVRDGRVNFSREIIRYALGCAAILNIPFALSLTMARHVEATEYALIVSTAPFWNYLLALVTGREGTRNRQLLAVAVGFVSSAVLILSRGALGEGGFNGWMIAAFSVPIIYSFYNWFTSAYWPKNADIMTVGAAESLFSGLLAVPFLLYFAPPWSADTPPFSAYWVALIAVVMWVVERVAFFTLIRDRGAVYTIQVIYVSTPAAVLWGVMIFGGGTDMWLWISLAILMVAIYLNNSTARVRVA